MLKTIWLQKVKYWKAFGVLIVPFPNFTLLQFLFNSAGVLTKLVILPSKAKPAAKYKPGWVSWYSVYHHIGTSSDFLFFPNQPYQFIISLGAECVCVVSSGNSSISKIGSLEAMISW